MFRKGSQHLLLSLHSEPVRRNNRANTSIFLARRLIQSLLILCAAFSLSACVSLQDPEGFQEYRQHTVISLQPGLSAGQDFISRRPALDSFQIWLRNPSGPVDPAARIEFSLYHLGEEQALISTSYNLQSLGKSDTFTFRFAPRYTDPPNQPYFVKIQVSGASLELLGRLEDAYPHGQAWLDNQPLAADLSFRTGYRYAYRALLADLLNWLGQAWLLLPLAALLWLPGRLVLRLARLDHRLDWGERSAAALGLSLALIPLVMLWSSALNIAWSASGLWLVTIALFIVYALSWLYEFRSVSNRPRRPQFSPHSLALVAILLLSLGVRLAMVRDMAAPAWVDSVHHALLTRLILEQGAFPASYAPYLETSTTSYHAGFHSLLAGFSWLSGLDIPQAMLILGQFLNALMVLAVYLFTTTFTHRPSAGVAAALISGLVTPMPAYYTSWGRYTQLSGLLILPVAFLLVKYLVEYPPRAPFSWQRDKEKVRILLLASLAIAGLLMVHYRVLAFLGALIAATLLVELPLRFIRGKFLVRQLLPLILSFAALAIFALTLTIFWWPTAMTSLILPTGAFSGSKTAFSDFSWSYLITAYGRYALGLAGLGFLWGLVRKRTFPLVMLFWISMLFFLANLGVFKLPGASFINNTSVAITLFLPTALLGGYLVGWVLDGWGQLLPQRWRSVYWSLACLALGVLGVLSGRALLPILNPATLLARQADLPAIHWVDENLPRQSKIAINPFLWGYGIYAGSDGGYWISPIAGRATLPPPALYNLNFSRELPRQISENSRQVQQLAQDPTALHQFLRQQGIDYVYIGVRGGVLSPQMLKDSPLYELIYENQGVFIFQVNP